MFSQILAVVQKVMPYIQTIIESALNIISGIIKVVTGIIEGDWSAVWEGIKQISGACGRASKHPPARIGHH